MGYFLKNILNAAKAMAYYGFMYPITTHNEANPASVTMALSNPLEVNELLGAYRAIPAPSSL